MCNQTEQPDTQRHLLPRLGLRNALHKTHPLVRTLRDIGALHSPLDRGPSVRRRRAGAVAVARLSGGLYNLHVDIRAIYAFDLQEGKA